MLYCLFFIHVSPEMKMVPKHLRRSDDESLGGDQNSLMTSLYELQGKIKSDKSVLRQPVDTGVRGVKDLIKAVVGGTQELQEILLNECTVIYECKICKNLFRSLVNFISHKRIYCIKSFSYFGENSTKQENEFFEQDKMNNQDVKYGTEVNLNKAKMWLTNDKIVPSNIKIEKNHCLKPTRRIRISPFKITRKCDIARIADSFNQKERNHFLMTPVELPDEVANTSDSANSVNADDGVVAKRSQQINLPSVINGLSISNSHKVSQICIEQESTSDYCDFPQSQRNDKISPSNEAVLQENGQFRVTPQGMKVEDNENLENNKCTLCNTHFLNKQTLSRHIQIHHKERICYPCPICRTFFPSPGSTYRHLSKDHHKTEQQIRRLRPKILTKACKRKLVDTHLRNETERTDNLRGCNGNGIDSGVPSCSICGKLFNRQAVLRVHSVSCREKDLSNVKSCSSNSTDVTKSKVPQVTSSEKLKSVRKSGILVRWDYYKKGNGKANGNGNAPYKLNAKKTENHVSEHSYNRHSLKRINKWRTVLEKLQSKNSSELSKNGNLKAD